MGTWGFYLIESSEFQFTTDRCSIRDYVELA